jgi:hypothetical protein
MRRCTSDRSWARTGAFALVILAGHPAKADETGAMQAGVAEYCEYAQSAARSAVAQQLYPRVFVSGSVLPGAGTVEGGRPADEKADVLWRVQAGASYSLADFNEAQAIRDKARAECAVYRQQSELFAFLARYDEPDSVPGALAKIGVLEAALPTAERILEEMRSLVNLHLATVEEVNATTLRVEGMRAEIGSWRARAAAIGRKHGVSPQPVAELMRAYREAVAELARFEARVRRSRRWDLSARAGYDRFFGVRDGVPIFGSVTLSFSPGSLTQPSVERQAELGRVGWAALGIEGVHDRSALLMSRLRVLMEAQAQRQRENAVLLADLEARHRALEAVQGDSVRAFRDYVWFDLTRLRAEDAYLRAQLAELHVLLPSEDAGVSP